MKLSTTLLAAALCTLGLATASAQNAMGQTRGNPGLRSIGPISFAPNGVILAADTRSAAVFAIETGDTARGDATKRLAVEGINAKVAALLGTTADEITINDIAVNPVSRNGYLAVSRGRSTDAVPVLVKVSLDGQLSVVSLDNVAYSKVEFANAPPEPAAPAAGAAPAQGRGRGNQRLQSITDIAYVDGKVVIAGLSNEEFASTLRMVNYPFTNTYSTTGIQIFHANHNALETHSPIRTFTSITEGNQTRILAAYTCTPLVDIALSQLAPGAKVLGKTIAELGNGNNPIDMFVYQKEGKNFLLMANDRRGVMKVGIDGFDKVANITERVGGQKYDGLTLEQVTDWTGIAHLDRLDNAYAVVLHNTGSGMNLESRALP